MLNDTPVSATDEEIENIKWTFRRTRKPKVLGKIFNTAEEQSKRRFRVNPFCPNPDCREEHAYFTIKLTEEEINKMNAFYDKNDEENNYNDIGILFMDEPPVVVVRDYVCPVCKPNSNRLCLYIVQTRLDTSAMDIWQWEVCRYNQKLKHKENYRK